MKKIFFPLIIAIFLLSACGNETENITPSFTVNPTEAVVGSVISFDATGSDGPIESFEWNFGDGATGTGRTVQHVYTSAKIFTAILTVKASSGAVHTSSGSVDIYREGRSLVIKPDYPGSNSDSAVWIEGAYSGLADPANFRAAFVISQDSTPHGFRSVTLGVVLPEEYLGYAGFQPYPHNKIYTYEELAISGGTIFYNFFDPDWTCFSNTFQALVVIVDLRKIGTGRIEFSNPYGIDCSQQYRFPLQNWGCGFEVKLSKHYDN